MNDAASNPTPDTLYSDRHGWLLGWLRGRLGGADHAADLAHDTFIRVLTHRDKLSALHEPRAWLRTIARGPVNLRFDARQRLIALVCGEILPTSGGHPVLDEEVLALIERAQPLPVPPDEVEGDPIELIVPVEFFLRRR